MTTRFDPSLRSTAALREFARRLASDDDPDDLLQDTWLTAVKDGSSEPNEPWLRRVLRNNAYQRYRARRRRMAREAHLVPHDTARAIDEQAFLAEVFEVLREGLQRLEAGQAEVLRQRYVECLSAAEIARVHGCPASTIRSRIRSGLRRLREHLDDRLGGREQWCPALALVVDFDPPPPTGIRPMHLVVSITVTGALALGAVALVSTTGAPEPSEPASMDDAARPQKVSATVLAPRPPAAADAAIPTGPTAIERLNAISDQVRASAPPDVEALEPLVFALDGGRPGDHERPERLGEFIECERLAGHPVPAKLVMFDYATDGHATTKMELVLDELGDPEVVECLRGAYEALFAAKELEYPDHDEPAGNLVGALFGADARAPSSREPLPDPQTYPLVVDAAQTKGGSGDRVVDLVICGDYHERHSVEAARTVDELSNYFGPRLRVSWLHAARNAEAPWAASAAHAAGLQGEFWPMHARLIGDAKARDEASVTALARALGLDVARFSADLRSSTVREALVLQDRTCSAHGGLGTPHFIIDGDRKITGNVPFDRLADEIEAASSER